MGIQGQRSAIDKLIWVLTVAFLTTICITATNVYGRYALLGFSVAIFACSIIQTKGVLRLELGRFHCHYIVFGLYILVSALWAWRPMAALEQSKTIFELLLCMSMIYVHYQYETDLWNLYSAVKWSGFISCLYTFFLYGPGTIFAVLISGGRLEVSFANINVLGVLAAFSVVITAYQLIFRKFHLLSVLLCLPCVLIVAASGTRKALLAVLLGIALIMVLRYKSKSFVKTALKFAGAGVVLVLLLGMVLSLPIFSGIMGRMEGTLALLTGKGEVDASTLERDLVIRIGMEQFWKTPFFGIGVGSSGALLVKNFFRDSYLHNNFVELLCCGGIVGFVIYYSMYYYCLRSFYQYRKSSDPSVKLGLILVILMLLMDFARVSYYSKPTVFYMMIFFLHIRNLKRRGRTQ